MKQLVWILAGITLFLRRGHSHDVSWLGLAWLLAIDIPVTYLLNQDMARASSLGDPARELVETVAEETTDHLQKAALTGLGVPEHLAEGYAMSRKAGSPQEIGLGCRAWANIIWTAGMAVISIALLAGWR